MYKLLLVSDQPDVLNAFSQITSWEELGFKKPRIVSSARTAIDALETHHADGTCIALPADDERTLMAYLTENRPILPIMDGVRSVEALVPALAELSRLLNKTHADFSNDDATEADMMQLCRHEFFRNLLGGQIATEKYIRTHMKLLRSRMDPDKPCVILDLAAPEGDDFISRRWHYGNERLETALRNFFGAELDGMRILVSVLPSNQIKLLCCPMIGAEVKTDSITAEVTTHAENNIRDVGEYLGVELSIENIHVLPKLTALAHEAG